MILRIPTVGVDSGPDWANNINASLSTIDLHDHSSGKGVKITPNGLNISSNLSFNSNSATTLRSVNFSSQSATLADFASVYVVGNDLWFTNGGGVPVQITSGGSIVGASGTISGLVSPASAQYASGTGSFSWFSNANIYAIMQSGDVRLYPTAYTSPNYVALQAPAILGTTQPSYTLVMPLKPSVQSFMTLDASGNMAAPWTVDNSTIEVAAGTTVQVKDQGITLSKLAAALVQLLAPTGSILAFGGTVAPSGHLLCDGSSYPTASYPALWGVIGYAFGGSGANFNVPDFRGRFLRGVTGSTSNDPDASSRTAMNTGGNTGNNVGSIQGDDFKQHTHNVPFGQVEGNAETGSGVLYNDVSILAISRTSTGASTVVYGNETRPKNAYVNYIIKT